MGAVMLLALAACASGAKYGANAELRDDELSLTNDAPSRPATGASAAPPPATPPPDAPPPAPVATAEAPLACPVRCAIATPHHRVLAADEEERLRGAFTPILRGLRSCANSSGDDGRQRAPGVMARFASSGELLDLGVDDTGWGQGADACFQSVARGGSNPDVRLEGPAMVRCSERCEAPKVIVKRKKK
jgi:hypothetical protein